MQKMLPLVIPVLAIVIVGSLLIYFDIKTGGITNIEEGSHVGYLPAVLTWVAFIASLIAMAGFCAYVAATTGPAIVRSSFTKRNVLIAVLVLVGAALALQFGTRVFTPLESGIASGVAPLALTWIAAVLTLFANLGFVIFVARNSVYKGERSMTKVNTGRMVSQTKAKETHTVAQIKQIDVLIGDPQDAALLAEDVTQERRSVYNRDAIQTRNNIAEWIVACISSEGKMAKKDLEQKFSEQFPRTLWPLFNSVVYDLVYQNRLAFAKRDGNEVLELKGQ